MKTKSLYIDSPSWATTIKVDDFIVAVGKTKTNSVYHVFEVKKVVVKNRIKRCYLSVVKSDLLTAIRRDETQRLIPMTWNKRIKKK